MSSASEYAAEFAAKAHAGQLDKQGAKYFLHVERVAQSLRPRGELYVIVGYLHDVLEDTMVTYDNLVGEFGQAVADAVNILTRPKDMTYREYIQRIIDSRDILAIYVKIADNIDNLRAGGEESLGVRYRASLLNLTMKGLIHAV